MPGADPNAGTGVFCLGCRYSLAGLGAGACPECGRRFDPEDAATFSTSPRRSLKLVRWLVLVALWPLLAHGMVFFCFLIARLSLGRWPYPGPPDNPSNITGLNALRITTLLVYHSSPPLFVIALIVALATKRRHGVRTTVLLCLLTCVLYLLSIVASARDPWLVLKWFFWD